MRALLSALSLVLALGVAVAAGDDPPPAAFTSPRAKEAVAERDAALRKADDELGTRQEEAKKVFVKKLDAAIKTAMQQGDLDEANRINALKKTLDQDADARDEIAALTSSAAKEARTQLDATVQKAQDDHRKKVGDATRACVKKLDGALKEAMRKSDLDEAKRIDVEKKAQEDELAAGDLKREKGGWVVLFRSSDPAIWNTDTNKGADTFAVPARKAPRLTKWVRVTRMDTHDAVILAVTKSKLTQRATDGDLAWEGSCQFAQGARHLGIDKAAWHRVVSDGGKIMVTHDRGNGGWGFGHKVHVNDKQYWSWAGDEIGETVFEIAVKAEALTKTEREQLLR